MKNKIFELYKPDSLQSFLQFNMLKWDKREYRYYPLEVDGYQKG